MTYRTSIRFAAGVITRAGPEPASSPRVSLADRMTGSKLLVPPHHHFRFRANVRTAPVVDCDCRHKEGIFRRADQEAGQGEVARTSPLLGDKRPFGLHRMNVFREGQTR